MKQTSIKQEDLIHLIDNFPGAIILIDSNATILALNKQLASILLKPREELIGSPAFIHLEKIIASSRMDILQQIVKKKKPVEWIDFERKRWWKTQAIPIINDQGVVDKVLGIISDITDQVEKEKNKIHKKEEYYKTLIHNSMDLITIIDEDFIIKYHSPSLKEILGFHPKDMIGKVGFGNIHPDDVDKVMTYFNSIKKKGGTHREIVYRVKDAQGSWKIFASKTNNQIHNPDINGIIAHTRDITESHETEERLLRSQKEYVDIFNHTVDGIIITDSNGVIADINPSAVHILGYDTKNSLIGKPTRILYANIHDREAVIKTLLKHEKISEVPLTFKRRDGKEIDTLGSATLIKNETGEIEKIFGIFRDITDIKNKEKQLQRSTKNLEYFFDHTKEMIFTVDNEYKIIQWNKTMEKITGKSKRDIQTKKISDVSLFENSKEIITLLENKKPEKLRNIIIKDTNGYSHILQPSISMVFYEDQLTDIIFICRDITHEQRMHQNFLSGISYIITDDQESFRSLLFNYIHRNFNTFLLTRNRIENDDEILSSNYIHYYRLSNLKNNKNPTINTLEELINLIKEFLQKKKNPVILIEGIEYLFHMYDFKDVYSVLCEISDLIYESKSNLFIHLHKALLSERILRILLHEFNVIPSDSLDNIHLDTHLFEILHYIQDETSWNKIVNYSRIVRHFGLSKVTAQRRIEMLLDEDLIFFKSKGRSKYLYLTRKGEQLLRKINNKH